MATIRKVKDHTNVGTLQQGDVVLGERTTGTTVLFTVPDLTAGGGAVDSVNGQTGVVVLTANDIIPGLTSSAAELNILDGATLSTAELNYVDGVTSSIQTQLDGKAASLGADDNYVTDAEKVKLSNLSGTNTGDQNVFSTVAVSGQSNVVADSTSDTLTLAAGSNITITTDATTDTITIASSGGGTPGGSNTQVQFNDSSAFGGDAGLTYNKTTDVLSVAAGVSIGGNSTAAGYAEFKEDTDNGSNKITLTAPSSITSDKTLTLPDVTGTIYASGGTDVAVADGGTGVSALPSFFVTRSAQQSINTNSYVKVQFDTETFDTNNYFDSTTNYRFTPQVAGKYLICVALAWESTVDQSYMNTAIYKNGAGIFYLEQRSSGTVGNTVPATAIVNFNGSTDYLEIYAYQDSGSARNIQTYSVFSGIWAGP